jgi:hypothetical protein
MAVEPLDESEPSAVRLFLERVTAADPRLLGHGADPDLVVGICQHCDGLPLALEFAAARAPLLGLPALHAELIQTATRLSAHTRSLPDRQASLRANLEWSLAILDPTARHLLQTLFVFDGGYTTAAAAAVADLDHPACSTGVHTLLRHSLLTRATSHTDTARFTLLQTTRDYLTDITDPATARQLKDRHARYFNTFLGPEPVSMYYPGTPAGWWQLMPERANLRAAIRWAVHTHQHQLAADLVASTYALWERLGPKPEHREWLTLLVDAEGVTDLRRADLLVRLGAWETNPSSACRLALAAIRILEHADDVHRLTVARALHLWKRELEKPGTPENLHAAPRAVGHIRDDLRRRSAQACLVPSRLGVDLWSSQPRPRPRLPATGIRACGLHRVDFRVYWRVEQPRRGRPGSR